MGVKIEAMEHKISISDNRETGITKMYRISVVIVVALIALGCQTNKHREELAHHKTKLFHPYMAEVASVINNGDVSKVSIDGPASPMVPSAAEAISDPADDAAASDVMVSLEGELNVMPPELAADLFGEYFARAFYVCDIYFRNKSLDGLLLYGASLNAQVGYLMAEKDVTEILGEKFVKHPEAYNIPMKDGTPLFDMISWQAPRRPMSFSDVLGIFDYRRLSDPKQQSVEWLKFVGVLATGAGMFVENPDFGEGAAYFTGIFVPEFEKRLLWDVLLHLKYLEARSLKEVEELAPGGMIHRIVFFPRLPIMGINPTHPVYISEIKGYTATADGIAIAKLGNTADDRKQAVAKMLAGVAFEAYPTAVETQAYADAIKVLADAKVRREEERKQEQAEKKERDAQRKSQEDKLNEWLYPFITSKVFPTNAELQALLKLLFPPAPVPPAPEGNK